MTFHHVDNYFVISTTLHFISSFQKKDILIDRYSMALPCVKLRHLWLPNHMAYIAVWHTIHWHILKYYTLQRHNAKKMVRSVFARLRKISCKKCGNQRKLWYKYHPPLREFLSRYLFSLSHTQAHTHTHTISIWLQNLAIFGGNFQKRNHASSLRVTQLIMTDWKPQG